MFRTSGRGRLRELIDRAYDQVDVRLPQKDNHDAVEKIEWGDLASIASTLRDLAEAEMYWDELQPPEEPEFDPGSINDD